MGSGWPIAPSSFRMRRRDPTNKQIESLCPLLISVLDFYLFSLVGSVSLANRPPLNIRQFMMFDARYLEGFDLIISNNACASRVLRTGLAGLGSLTPFHLQNPICLLWRSS